MNNFITEDLQTDLTDLNNCVRTTKKYDCEGYSRICKLVQYHSEVKQLSHIIDKEFKSNKLKIFKLTIFARGKLYRIRLN